MSSTSGIFLLWIGNEAQAALLLGGFAGYEIVSQRCDHCGNRCWHSRY